MARSRRFPLVLLLFALVAPGRVGAAPAPAAPGSALVDGRPARFLVGGWCIAGAYARPDWLVAIDAAGFDYVQNLDHHFAPEYGVELLRQLDSLRAARPGFGLQAIVALSRGEGPAAAFTARADVSPDSLAAVARTLRAGGPFHRPSTLGYLLWDEPGTREEMARLGTLARFLRGNPDTRGRLAMANLYPIADAHGGGGYAAPFRDPGDRRGGYAAYLDAWLAAFDALPAPAPVLSFDHYPYQGRGRPRADFEENLSIANQRALAYGRPGVRVPLWVVVQLGRHRPAGEPYAATPTFRQTRLQVWLALAHGAKGISYWTLFPTGRPEGPRFDFGAWNEQGRPGPDLPALAALNRALHGLGPTLMVLDAVATFRGRADGALAPDPASPTAAFFRPVRRVLAGVGRADLKLGLLRHQATGDWHLLVVNTSLARTRRFRLELAAPADTIERIDPRNGHAVRAGAGTRVLDAGELPPASGALFRLGGPLVAPVPGVLEAREAGAELVLRTARGIVAQDRATGATRRLERMIGESTRAFAVRPEGLVRAD